MLDQSPQYGPNPFMPVTAPPKSKRPRPKASTIAGAAILGGIGVAICGPAGVFSCEVLRDVEDIDDDGMARVVERSEREPSPVEKAIDEARMPSTPAPITSSPASPVLSLGIEMSTPVRR